MARRPHVIVMIASQLRCDVLGAYGGVGHPGRASVDQGLPVVDDAVSAEAHGLGIITRSGELDAPDASDSPATSPGSMLGTSVDFPSITPNLDKFAAGSNVFDRHFTNCPLTIPARASLISGLLPFQHGARIAGWLPAERSLGRLRPEVALLPHRLMDAGYRVVHSGAQQLRLPEGGRSWQGIDVLGPTAPVSFYRDLSKRGVYLGDPSIFQEPVLEHHAGHLIVHHATGTRISPFPLREEYFYDSVVAQRTADLIGKHDSDKPLALFVNFWLPHAPMWVPKAWANLVDHRDVKLPGNVGQWFPGQAATQLQNLPGQLGAHVSMDRWLKIWATYLGMVAMLDHCVGRVIAALEQRNMFDTSMIIFTADHGEMLGSHAMFTKHCMYDEAVKIPMILRMPGQSRGRRIGELTDHLDTHATILDFVGAPGVPHSSGTGLLTLATGGGLTGTSRPYVFAMYDGNGGRGFAQRMIRSRSHKLIHNLGDRVELYDLLDDPGETSNLAGRGEVRDIEKTLTQALNAWMEQVGDDADRCPMPGELPGSLVEVEPGRSSSGGTEPLSAAASQTISLNELNSTTQILPSIATYPSTDDSQPSASNLPEPR